MQNENSQLNGSPADNVGRQLERIANLLGLLATHGKPQVEQIAVLSGAGYTPSEIAQLVGTTPNTVSVALSQMRAARKRKKQKKGKRGS
jgi:predicted transcriptional regulator